MTRPFTQHYQIRDNIVAGLISYCTVVPSILICYFLLEPIFQSTFPLLSLLCLWAGLTTVASSFWTRMPIILIPNISVISLVIFSLYWGEAWSKSHLVLLFFMVNILLLIVGFLRIGKLIENALPPFYSAALMVGLGVLLISAGLRLGGFITAHPITLSVWGEMTTRSTVIITIGLSFYFIARIKSYLAPMLWGLGAAVLGSFLLNTPKNNLTAPSLISSNISDIILLPNFEMVTVDLIPAIMTVSFIIVFESLLIGYALRYYYPQTYNLDRIFKICGIGGIFSAICGLPGSLPAPEGLGAVISNNRSWQSGLFTGGLLILSAFILPILSLPGSYIRVGPEVLVYPIGGTLIILVGIGCLTAIRRIDWHANDQLIVALTICILVPITQSILNGFGISLLIYVGYQILNGESRNIPPILYVLNVIFILKFLY